MTETIIDKAGDAVIDTKVTNVPHEVIPAHAEFSNDLLIYVFAGYEAKIETVCQKTGAGFDTYHGALGWDRHGAYRKASEGMGLDKGHVTTGDLIEYHVGLENNTQLAKDDVRYKNGIADHGISPDAAAMNARLVLKLDDYYDFNDNFASQKPANYVGKRMKLVSIDGDYIDYDYDEEHAVVTVNFGDIPLGGKRALTVVCEILPMPGVKESMLKLTPNYSTDNLSIPSWNLAPFINVARAPGGNPYEKPYDDYGLVGQGQYVFKVVD